ncbi:MAG: nucleotidyltransferase domain-containing protein [Haliscomenobacter sp.]|uniref:nucleotidyltransferase domain-containing protein n=1 Tax=Haliscomenobacter sp. TaxID=2717303 RepID=UPI0029B9481C|nr:nucleotidyltransferase domain-containing protein [Haliscomenobacter sp.]MDX2071788.1 nucleotidyltransferase domain-containing protein [Haliscomenobacter sp.]
MQISDNKQKLLDDITAELKLIDGVKAIVLGGSYAVGAATESSDLDIGIYYCEQNPFDIEKVKIVANKYAHNEKPTVTAFYEWGPWVNGGAWINTEYGEVDFLYKNIDQIAKTIDNAKNGVWENHYEQQPPYGFSSVIFLSETHYSLPLFDPDDVVMHLKENVKQYPQKLKQSIIQQSLWSAEFTIWQAEKLALKADIYSTVGCLARAMNNIVSALFALNEIYPMGDKRAIDIIETAKNKPTNLTNKINSILSCDKNSLKDNVEHLKFLFNEVVELASGQYKPYYKLQ